MSIRRDEEMSVIFEEYQPVNDRGDTGQDWLSVLQRQPGACKAIHFDDSIFDDSVGYAEYKQHRMPHPRYVATSKNKGQRMPLKTLKLEKDTAYYAHVTHEMVRMHSCRIQTTADGVTPQEVIQTMTYKAKHCMKYLTDDQIQLFAQYLANSMQKPTVEGTRWEAVSDEQWHIFAEVSRDCDEDFIEFLKARGARIEDNLFEVQEYDSVHEIHPGVRLALADGPRTLSYVSHGQIGEKTVQEWTHRVTRVLPSVAQMREAVLDTWAKRIFTPEELLMVTRTYEKTGQEVEEISIVRWMRRKQREALLAGETWPSRTPHGKATEHARAVTVDDLAASDWAEVSDGQWMRHKNFVDYDRSMHAYAKLYQKQAVLELVWVDGDNQEAPARLSPTRLVEWTNSFQTAHLAAIDNWYDGTPMLAPPISRETLRARDRSFRFAVNCLEDGIRHRRLPRAIKSFFLDADNLHDDVAWQVQFETRQVPIHHRAPLSERGLLRVNGDSIPQLLAWLEKLGVAAGASWDLPYPLQPPARNGLGRVRPLHDAYESEALPMPDDCMLLHGMTGAGDGAAAMRRLESIAQSGGLKSTAERRRMGVGVQSMSPRGDIVSGIDGGVPCKIGKQPHYGSLIIFGMKPSVLHRRDLFFSPCDYGGGKNRYPMFTKYAEEIGQERIWMPPSHEARVKHLTTGIDREDNEVYLRHEISWEEIDTVWIHESISDTATTAWQTWCAEGLIPTDVQLVVYEHNDQLHSLIRKRSRVLAGKPEEEKPLVAKADETMAALISNLKSVQKKASGSSDTFTSMMKTLTTKLEEKETD